MKPAAWIRLIAYRERPPLGVRPGNDAHADVASRIGRRIVNQLRASIAAEIASAVNGTKRPAARIEDRRPFGFQVAYIDADSSHRMLTIALVGRMVSCKYSLVNANSVPGCKSQWLTFAADQRALIVWDQGVRRGFDGIEALAAFLFAALSNFEGPGCGS